MKVDAFASLTHGGALSVVRVTVPSRTDVAKSTDEPILWMHIYWRQISVPARGTCGTDRVKPYAGNNTCVATPFLLSLTTCGG